MDSRLNDTSVPLLVLDKALLAHMDITPQHVLNAVEMAYRGLGECLSDNPRKLMSEAFDGHSIAYSMLGRDGVRATVGFKTSYKHDPEKCRETNNYYTTLLLFDDETGMPIALMDGSLVGALRTPAVSALLARVSAPDARTVLVVGTGTQGRMALPLLLAALPKLERLIVHGHYESGIQAVRDQLQRFYPERDIEVSSHLEAATRQADIVIGVAGKAVTETVHYTWLKPGALAVLVGYGIDKDVLYQASYRIATSTAQMQVTGQDLVDASGQLPIIDAELPDILLGRKAGREKADQIVFAYNSGMVVTDIALGRILAEQARDKKLGQYISLW